MNRRDGFEYTYTSLGESGRREVERLMADYRTSDDLARLRMLDFKARRLPALVATLMGTAGALALAGGIAMSLMLSAVPGALLAAAGACVCAAAYPAYVRALKRGKAKYGEEILRLTDKLLGEDEKGSFTKD